MIYFISGHRDITQEEFDANYVAAKNQMGIAVKELKAKYPADGKKIADLVKANLCN